jgi:hypothetical protein
MHYPPPVAAELSVRLSRCHQPLCANPNAAQRVQSCPAHVTLHPAGHPLSLPEGWLDCPRMGERCFDHFVPCKVPLGQRFDSVLRDLAVRFTPAQAVQEALRSKVPGEVCCLSAVVDLTKTKRYYNPEELGLDDLRRHVKVECSGSDGAPSPLEVNQFCTAVLEKLNVPAMPPPGGFQPKQAYTRVVLVHCTHGFNRTGAMLVHYAMRMLSPPIGKKMPLLPHLPSAVLMFARCRQPGIYKEEYIACACCAASRMRVCAALTRAPLTQRCSSTITRSAATRPARRGRPGSARRRALRRCVMMKFRRATCGVRKAKRILPPASLSNLSSQAWTTSRTWRRALSATSPCPMRRARPGLWRLAVLAAGRPSTTTCWARRCRRR